MISTILITSLCLIMIIAELKEFLEKPYEPLPIEIKQKYSFTNWIKYIFDEKPYQEINLPFDKNIEPASNAS